eukprot:126728-Pyramimonas_sp.AAC.1
MGLHRRLRWQRPHGVPVPILAHPSHASWPQREVHRGRYPQLRYTQLHMVGSFARIVFDIWCYLSMPLCAVALTGDT